MFFLLSSTIEKAEKATSRRSRISFDFGECLFLQQNAVVLLGGLARLLQQQGTDVAFRWNTLEPKVRLNLERNGFMKAFGGSVRNDLGNCIPFKEHGVPTPAEVIPYLEEHWLDRGWIALSEEVRSAVLGNLWEIYANAAEHAGSPVGVFTCGQMYPKLRKIRLAIVDFGIGIPGNVRKYAAAKGSKQTPADRALKWAFQQMATTAVGRTRGLGLHTIKELVQKNKGKLEVYSNDGHCIIDSSGEKYTCRSSSFQGTIVNIELVHDNIVYCFASESGRRR